MDYLSPYYGQIRSAPAIGCAANKQVKKLAPKNGKPSIYHPNPFAPHGGAKEWCSNELILHDVDLRRLARVRPLDCGLHDVYVINPVPKL